MRHNMPRVSKKALEEALSPAAFQQKIDSLNATITAQSRLLALALEMSMAVGNYCAIGKARGWIIPDETLAARQKLASARKAFAAALTEFQTHGAVPCGECDAEREARKKAEEFAGSLEGPRRLAAEARDLRRQLADVHNSEAVRQSIGQKVYQERDDLRRQLAEAKEAREQDARYYLKCAEEERMALTEKRMQAQADNGALVEAVKRLGCDCRINEGCCDATPCATRKIKNAALSHPHPGSPLLEELAALRELEAAVNAGTYDVDPIYRAIEKLDAIRNREGR